MGNNSFIHPSSGFWGRLINRIIESNLLLLTKRALLSRLPFLQLASDVENVVYCTWVVDVAAIAPLIPPGVNVINCNGRTLFTVLTYKHKHFGPAVFGPFRLLFPSPLQSNWRLYVDTLPGGKPVDGTVLFVKNVFSHSLYAIGSRLFSDVLPSHLARSFIHTVSDNCCRTLMSGGEGSAPDLYCSVKTTDTRIFPDKFAMFFNDWFEAVTFLTLQHAAITYVEDCNRLAYASIDLPIDVDAVQPMEASEVIGGSDLLTRIGATGEAMCFIVPSVSFRVLSEQLLKKENEFIAKE